MTTPITPRGCGYAVFGDNRRPSNPVRQLLIAVALLGPTLLARRATASDDIARLMSRASQRGTVRVLARLDVPAAPQSLSGTARVDSQLQAIRSSRAAVARALDGTAST